MQSRAPRGLLGMLALLVVVETFVAHHDLDFSRFSIHDWAVGGRAAHHRVKSCSVLCLGDSLVKFGVAPAVLEERTGKKAYNLAVCGGQAPSSYFLLRRALESGARPSALVVDFVPYLLAAEPRHNLRQWPELIDLREAIDLGWSTKHAQFCAELALGMLLRTVRDRDEIQSSIAAALRGESSSHRSEIDAWVWHWKLHRGAMLFHEKPEYRGEVDISNRGLFPDTWKCHPVNEVYVRRLLDLASTHGIKVFWLLPPTVPKFQDHSDRIGLESSHDRFLLGLQSRYPDLTFIDGRHSGYGHALFVDPLHLSRRGAVALSADLAAILDGKPSSRWIVLPDYHEPRSESTTMARRPSASVQGFRTPGR